MIGYVGAMPVSASPLLMTSEPYVVVEPARIVPMIGDNEVEFGTRFCVIKRSGLEIDVNPRTGDYAIDQAQSRRYGTATVRVILGECDHLDVVITNPAADEVEEPTVA